MKQQEFIKMVFPGARKLHRKMGIFTSITLAQGALESAWGDEVPTDIRTGQYSYNLFGEKGVGPAGTVTSWTWEEIMGQRIQIRAQFKAYNSFEESILGREALFSQDFYFPVLQAQTPEEQAQALQDCGYATDSRYAKKLFSLIEDYNLKQYDGPFPDVPWSRPSAPFIAAIKKAGFMVGNENGHFDPAGGLTREQAATVLVLALGLGLEIEEF